MDVLPSGCFLTRRQLHGVLMTAEDVESVFESLSFVEDAMVNPTLERLQRENEDLQRENVRLSRLAHAPERAVTFADARSRLLVEMSKAMEAYLAILSDESLTNPEYKKLLEAKGRIVSVENKILRLNGVHMETER